MSSQASRMEQSLTTDTGTPVPPPWTPSTGSGTESNKFNVRLKIDSRCHLGEAATWCKRSERLFWTDIDGGALWIYDSRKDWSRSLQMPERVACIGLCKDPRYLLLGLATQLVFYDIISERIAVISEIEPDLPTRLNDGRCDRQGRFVFGTKHDVESPVAIGGFHRLNADLSVERLPLPSCAVANSIAFSPDGSVMYYCDSLTREIRACDYPTFRNDRIFVRLGSDDGFPDGSVIDMEGGIWNAHWDGGCVVRYAPDGRETVRIALPVSRPTCIAFGGHTLGTLYVTSAHSGQNDNGGARFRSEGGVFAATPGILGIAEPLFGYEAMLRPSGNSPAERVVLDWLPASRATLT